MSSTLSEGVRVPDIGSVNWGADVNFNWGLLNTCLANISGNVKVDAENTWTAPQTFTETISGSIDGVAARAVGDEDGNNIKSALAGKQSSLSQSQLDACNSGVTSAAVAQIGTNTADISSLQTAVSGKAADADVVHKARTETITGDKTFTGANKFENVVNIINNGVTRGVIPSTNKNYIINLLDSQGNSVGMLFQQIRSGSGSYKFTLSLNNGATDHRLNFFGFVDGTSSLIPETSGVTDLGSSSAKWKTLNGINPGALSLPDTYINLDTTDWNLTGTSFNYVPSIDGWLFINVRPNNNYAYVAIEAAHMRNNSENTTGRNAMACIAVRKNVSTTITLVGASIAQARLVSCAGNV